MLDEFPALGRLDFFEQAMAFMAGYRIKGFLIAQSLDQFIGDQNLESVYHHTGREFIVGVRYAF